MIDCANCPSPAPFLYYAPNCRQHPLCEDCSLWNLSCPVCERTQSVAILALAQSSPSFATSASPSSSSAQAPSPSCASCRIPSPEISFPGPTIHDVVCVSCHALELSRQQLGPEFAMPLPISSSSQSGPLLNRLLPQSHPFRGGSRQLSSGAECDESRTATLPLEESPAFKEEFFNDSGCDSSRFTLHLPDGSSRLLLSSRHVKRASANTTAPPFILHLPDGSSNPLPSSKGGKRAYSNTPQTTNSALPPPPSLPDASPHPVMGVITSATSSPVQSESSLQTPHSIYGKAQKNKLRICTSCKQIEKIHSYKRGATCKNCYSLEKIEKECTTCNQTKILKRAFWFKGPTCRSCYIDSQRARLFCQTCEKTKTCARWHNNNTTCDPCYQKSCRKKKKAQPAQTQTDAQ